MIVYTCITNSKDELKEFEKEEGVKYLAFLDEVKDSKLWEVRKADDFIDDSYLRAKWYKLHPHSLFDDISLWVDGNISLKIAPTSLLKYLGGYDIALFKHSERDCTYKEGVAVTKYGYEFPEVVEEQMLRYFEEGFPVNYGLTYNGFILRRNTKKIQELNEMWWGEIRKGSRRDQLSFMYCCWKLGVKPNIIDVGDVHTENDYYVRKGHNYESKLTGN